jgi:hypothetical protein
MATIHSRAMKVVAARPQSAGAVHAAIFTHSFAEAFTAAGNVLELGYLPSYAKPVGYKLIPEGAYGGATLSMGLLAGAAGEDGVRAQGTEFLAAATALTAAVEGVKPTAFAIAPSAVERGIGVTLSADVAADAAKKLTLILFYTQ